MISIIISTYRSENLKALNISIQKTIGVPYEIIAIQNNGEKGICEVYNNGASKAIYNILCFCHEDIVILTQDWGECVKKLFDENSNLGLLGVAGSTYKSVVPAGWALIPPTRSVNIIQHFKFSDDVTYNHYENYKHESLTSVACIDGVWMCTKKEIALKIKFDQDTFKSFHCYDIDFSLNILKHYTVAVTYDILLEHFSEGKFDKSWIIENIKFYKKWVRTLPINLDNLPLRFLKKYETDAGIDFIHSMKKHEFSLNNRFRLLVSFLFSNYIDKTKILTFIANTIVSYLKKVFLNSVLNLL